MDCAAIKADCLARFPIDPGNPLPLNDPNWDCMKASGYVKSCMSTQSYDLPGATTYPLDVLTNPQNPDSILPDLSSVGISGMGTWGIVAIAGAALFLFMSRR